MSDTSNNGQSVPEIIAHEAKELARLQQAKAAYAAEIEAKKTQFEQVEHDEEKNERAAATAVLQSFGNEEIPRMLASGEAAREKAVETAEGHAKQQMSPVAKSIISKALSGSLLS